MYALPEEVQEGMGRGWRRKVSVCGHRDVVVLPAGGGGRGDQTKRFTVSLSPILIALEWRMKRAVRFEERGTGAAEQGLI